MQTSKSSCPKWSTRTCSGVCGVRKVVRSPRESPTMRESQLAQRSKVLAIVTNQQDSKPAQHSATLLNFVADLILCVPRSDVRAILCQLDDGKVQCLEGFVHALKGQWVLHAREGLPNERFVKQFTTVRGRQPIYWRQNDLHVPNTEHAFEALFEIVKQKTKQLSENALSQYKGALSQYKDALSWCQDSEKKEHADRILSMLEGFENF